MRAVVQRVARAEVVTREGEQARIGPGFLVLLGIKKGDTLGDAAYLAAKIKGLRIFADAAGRLNLSLKETRGEVLVVSQFTLYGDCRHGRRPSFSTAATGEEALGLYQAFVRLLEEHGLAVKTGVFGAAMQVSLINDGPVTLLLDSERAF